MDKTVLCENEKVLAIDLSDLSDNAVEAIKKIHTYITIYVEIVMVRVYLFQGPT